MNKGRHRKLYYVPGLISLVLLPFLFAYFGKKQLQKLDQRVIEVNALYPDLLEEFPLPQRSYKTVRISGDESQDQPAIENAKGFIRGIYAKEDTINGVHFILEDSVSYGTYVHLLNFFKMDSIKAYAIYNNNIWVLRQPDPKPTDDEYVFICGNLLYNDVVISKANEARNFDTILKPYLPALAKQWPAIIILIILTALSIKQIITHLIHTSHQST